MDDDGRTLRGRPPDRVDAWRHDGRNPADRLVRAIEGQIIPRLMLVHRVATDARPTARVRSGLRPDPGDVAALADLVVGRDAATAVAFAEGLLAHGLGVEALYLDLLAPAARLLGERWDADELDFVQVTLGLCRLQQVVRALTPAFLAEPVPELTPRVLLTALPGELHTFGLAIVGDFFRRAGWEVWEKPGACRADLLDLVRRESFALIGLSVACDSRISAAAAMIAAMRRESLNRQVAVMVGGQAFAGHPERATRVGADGTADDGREAAAHARALLAQRSPTLMT